MASFLHPCVRCAGQVRFASPHDVPAEVRCESCVADLLVESLREPTAKEMAQIKRTRPKRAQLSMADLKANEESAQPVGVAVSAIRKGRPGWVQIGSPKAKKAAAAKPKPRKVAAPKKAAAKKAKAKAKS